MSKTSFLLIAAGLTIACMAGWLAASANHANGDKTAPSGWGGNSLPLVY